MTDLPDDLGDALNRFVGRRRVLVGVDFDGTLAPFVTDPMEARAVPGGLEALHEAATLPGVVAALVSGRDVETLGRLTGVGRTDAVVLIGSHGAQTNRAPDRSGAPGGGETGAPGGRTGAPAGGASGRGGQEGLLAPAQQALLATLEVELEQVAAAHPGARIERKPAAVALHTRGLEAATSEPAQAGALEVSTRHTGVHVLPGKEVVELTVLDTSKGSALRGLAGELDLEAVLYIGDDVTDERAFEVLDPARGDVTVKVGDGPTAATHRVSGVDDVVTVLDLFVTLRTDATRG